MSNKLWKPIAGEAEVAQAWLAQRIAALAEESPGPQWSRAAYTQAGTVHVAFANGARHLEGARYVRLDGYGPMDCAIATLKAVEEYRAAVGGAAHLVWRTEPEITVGPDGGWTCYTRLAFDPAPTEETLRFSANVATPTLEAVNGRLA